MKETGPMVFFMVKVIFIGQIILAMRDHINSEKNMVKANMFMRQKKYIEEIGTTAGKVEKVN